MLVVVIIEDFNHRVERSITMIEICAISDRTEHRHSQ